MRTALFVLVPALCLAALLTPAAACADEAKEAPEHYVISIEEAIPLETFLQTVARTLDVPFVWDPKARGIQGRQVVGGQTLRGTKEEIYGMVRSLLTFYDLVIVPVGPEARRRYLVVEARQHHAVLRVKPKYVEIDEANAKELEGQDGLYVTTAIKVKHIDNLRDARNALNRLVTMQNIGNVTEVPAARAFVVTDFAPNVVAIWRLLRMMDVPAAEQVGRIFRAVRLGHAEATPTAETLQAHFNANSGRPRRQPQPGRAAVPMAPHTPLQIHADPRLNQLLVSGPEEDVKRVLEVVEAMDRAAGEEAAKPVQTEIEVVRLQHIQALEVQGAIQSLLVKTADVWTLGGKEPLPAVVGHRETNALILQGTPAALVRLRRLVTELDQPKPNAGGEGGGG